jgi:hypothetical protein
MLPTQLSSIQASTPSRVSAPPTTLPTQPSSFAPPTAQPLSPASASQPSPITFASHQPLMSLSSPGSSLIVQRPAFLEFPWQNGCVLHAGLLQSRLEAWITQNRARLDHTNEGLLLVSV